MKAKASLTMVKEFNAIQKNYNMETMKEHNF